VELQASDCEVVAAGAELVVTELEEPELDGLGLQVPYIGSQFPTPQYAVVEPHVPYMLQQFPKTPPRHVWPPFALPQWPETVTGLPVEGVQEPKAD